MKTLLHIVVPWKMRLMGLLSGLLFFTAECLAQRNSLTPYDFQPLTSLPWKDTPQAPVEENLKRIYQEPEIIIRRPVLACYLEELPPEKLAAAFDCCIKLEGTQWPEDLVAMFLHIWAKRDPQGAWQRTRQLMDVMTASSFSWLDLDGWQNRKVRLVSQTAFQKSSFWLGDGLGTFLNGLQESSLPDGQKAAILEEFSRSYLQARGEQPNAPRDLPGIIQRLSPQSRDHLESGPLVPFQNAAEAAAGRGDRQDFEIVLRQWVVKSPGEAPDILRFLSEVKWKPSADDNPTTSKAETSDAFLLLWSRLDKPRMIRWSDALTSPDEEPALRTRGLLMSQVDASTRERWLAAAKHARSKDDDVLLSLLCNWARWDPKAALATALDFSQSFFEPDEKAFFLGEVVSDAVYNMWNEGDNSLHHALGVIRDLDLSALPEEARQNLGGNILYMVMEAWGEVDAGETARFGVKELLSSNYCPRDQLLRFFEGDDSELAGEDGLVDRTFCALRTWAMTQPNDMKAWIATVKEEDMRQALTWLLENPWGTGEE